MQKIRSNIDEGFKILCEVHVKYSHAVSFYSSSELTFSIELSQLLNSMLGKNVVHCKRSSDAK